MSCFSTVVLAPKSSAELEPILSASDALRCSGCLLGGEDMAPSEPSVTDGTLVLKVRAKKCFIFNPAMVRRGNARGRSCGRRD